MQAELAEATADSAALQKSRCKEQAFAVGRRALSPSRAALEALELLKDEELELRACCAGMAAAEATVHRGAEPQEALETAAEQALRMAKSLQVANEVQCAALAQGAVIGRAAVGALACSAGIVSFERRFKLLHVPWCSRC